MAKRKVLGLGVDGRDVVNFNIKLLVHYWTKANEEIKRVAVIPVQTTNKEAAINIAKEKAMRQIEGLACPESSIIIELAGRNKKGEV